VASRVVGPRVVSRAKGWLTAPWPDRYKPWRGRATRTDKLLMGAFTALVLFGFATKPLKPFLLASHPVALEVLSGDLIPIGAAAAFARIGETSIWLVLAAGAIGMVKFDWLIGPGGSGARASSGCSPPPSGQSVSRRAPRS